MQHFITEHIHRKDKISSGDDMSILNYQQPIAKNVQMIDAFGGLNKHFRISENEFSDVMNMTADDYPVISTRRSRKHLMYKINGSSRILPALPADTCSIVYVNDIPCVLTERGEFFYDKHHIIIDYCYNNKLLRVGNMLYAYPSGVIIRLPVNENDEITVENTAENVAFGKNYSYSVYDRMICQPANIESVDNCSYYDDTLTYKIGQYAWKESEKGFVLERYCGDDKGWEGMVASLIRVEMKSDDVNIQHYARKFNAGDIVFISGTGKMNGVYLIEYVSDDAIYLQGNIESVHEEINGKIERRMPELDYVIEHNGRLWGCRYGQSADGEFVNEIYSTALNSPMNWYRFQGTSQDSYAVSLTSDGKFTGVAVIGGYVTFFKERYMHRIYGTLPENFQLYSVSCNGIQENCEDSLVMINSVAYYRSPVGVMSMSEGLPVLVSDKLGNDRVVSAVSGTDGRKYYSIMTDINSEKAIYVYDTMSGIWHKEDCDEEFMFFFNHRNSLYMFAKESIKDIKERIRKLEILIAGSDNPIVKAVAKAQIAVFQLLVDKNEITTGKILCISDNPVDKMPKYFNPDDSEFDESEACFENEDDFSWMFTTGDIGYSSVNKKYISQIVSRMLISEGATVNIEISYNYTDEWTPVYSLTGTDYMKTENVSIIPARCDTFKLRFSGRGQVKVCSVSLIYSEGNEK